MKVVKLKYTPRIDGVAASAIDEAKKIAFHKAVDALKTHLIQSGTMPFDVGTMQNTSTYIEEAEDRQKATLITNTPYARRLYYNPDGFEFQKNNNKKAQDHWLETYLTGDEKEFLKNKFEYYFRKELKKRGAAP